MKIEIYGQNELVERIKDKKEITSHLVSMGNPKRIGTRRSDSIIPRIFKKNYKGILRLEFYDVEKKEHLGNMRPKRIPMQKDVQKAIKFFRKHEKQTTGFTIHCWRGISRSTAIALGYLYLIHNDEQIAVDELKKIRPEASPHPGLVSFFDEILGCNLSKKNEQLREIRFREKKEWFFNEIEDGDALIEELEQVED